MERGGDEVGPLSLNLWLSAHRYSGPQETFGAAWKWCWLFQWGWRGEKAVSCWCPLSEGQGCC